MSKPTKQEILEKYKDKISAADFEILAPGSFPTPIELQREQAFMEFLGQLGGWAVWAKRTIGGLLLALILLHDGWETYRDFSPYAIKAYEEAQTYVTHLFEHRGEPATDFIFFTQDTTLPPQSSSQSQHQVLSAGTVVYPISGSWKMV